MAITREMRVFNENSITPSTVEPSMWLLKWFKRLLELISRLFENLVRREYTYFYSESKISVGLQIRIHCQTNNAPQSESNLFKDLGRVLDFGMETNNGWGKRGSMYWGTQYQVIFLIGNIWVHEIGKQCYVTECNLWLYDFMTSTVTSHDKL